MLPIDSLGKIHYFGENKDMVKSKKAGGADLVT